ncbi:MAG: AbrB/MazE/SpoVT family DNA-binding domain-containing protein [Oceanipulchritudo sp.]
MRTRVAKWGNSLGVRLPKALTKSLSLEDGTEVELREADGKLLLEPLHRQYRLEKLLEGIRPENLHGEIGAGKPTGKEAW